MSDQTLSPGAGTHTCRKPNIANHSYEHEGRAVENRLCLTCEKHWWDGREYTRNQWDRLMESAEFKPPSSAHPGVER